MTQLADTARARPATMRASVLCGKARVEVRDLPRPVPGPRDVLLRVQAVGLCGTDFHIFAGHANYHTDRLGRPIPLDVAPQVLGHEIAAVVEEAGREVTDLRPGDRVIVDQGLNCTSAARTPLCEYCATGDSHQCEYYGEHGITGLQGGLAEFICVPAVNAVRLSTGLDPAFAALSEPLACLIHASDAVDRARARYAIDHPDPARRVGHVFIAGAGPAGLLLLQWLRRVRRFDGTIIVSEPTASRRALAERFGATTIDPGAVDPAEAVLDLTAGRRVEYLVDASGSGELFRTIPGLVRKQGTILLYAHGQSGVDLGVLNNIQFLEPTLVSPVGASGGFDPDGRPSVYRRALRLIEDGTIEVAPLVTHRYRSLDEVPAALGGAHRAPDYVKGVVCLG